MTIDRRMVLFGVATIAAVSTAQSVLAEPTQAPITPPAERVLGIGGFFFRSRDPKLLAQWYHRHLGVDPVPTDYGQSPWQQSAGPTAFSPFPMDDGYIGSPQQVWMLNFRVRNLDAMVAQLRNSNIEVKVDPEKYPNGRFARLQDPENNPIELWEPTRAP